MRWSEKPSLRGMLFDMDGVLLVTSQSATQSWREVSQHFSPLLGIPLEVLVQAFQESRQAYKREIEADAEKQRRDRLEPFETRLEMVTSALQALHREEDQIAADIVQAYEALRETHRHLAPHALDVLQELRTRGVPLALLSNGNATYQRRKIALHQLASFFEVILIEEEFGAGKPDHRLFLSALEGLHLQAHETWMIGDDLARDIAGAQRVGIFAIWCDLVRQGLPPASTIRPDWVIHDLAEVPDMLMF